MVSNEVVFRTSNFSLISINDGKISLILRNKLKSDLKTNNSIKTTFNTKNKGKTPKKAVKIKKEEEKQNLDILLQRKPKKLSEDDLKKEIKKKIKKQKEKKLEDDVVIINDKPKSSSPLYSALVKNFYFMEMMYGDTLYTDYSKLYSHMGLAKESNIGQQFYDVRKAGGDNLGEKEIVSEKEVETAIVHYKNIRVFGTNEADISIDLRERFKYWKELNKWKLEMKYRHVGTGLG